MKEKASNEINLGRVYKIPGIWLNICLYDGGGGGGGGGDTETWRCGVAVICPT